MTMELGDIAGHGGGHGFWWRESVRSELGAGEGSCSTISRGEELWGPGLPRQDNVVLEHRLGLSNRSCGEVGLSIRHKLV